MILTEMLAGVAAAACGDIAARPRLVAEVLARFVAEPGLLQGRDCPGAAERYTRHELADDPGGSYGVAALVWRPGQMSRVHSHQVWCALGVHRGVLTETTYEWVEGEAMPEPCASLTRRPGDTSHGPADPRLIHRVANLGTRDAISIHVYGAPFARFSTSVNRILAT